jgi:hypothetical protein
MARKRRRNPGSLAQLRASLWRVIRDMEDLLDDPECPPERVLRCAHAFAQVAGAYRGVTEVADLEERLAKLEASMSVWRNA